VTESCKKDKKSVKNMEGKGDLSNSSNDARKSTLKTIRIPESLARSLEEEAAGEGMTVNALVNSVLGKYSDWDKKANEFGFLHIHASLFTRLVDVADEEALARIGRGVLFPIWKEMAEYFYQDSSPNKILEVLCIRSRLFPRGLRASVTREDGKYVIVYHHPFGLKWSIVLKSALQELVKKSFHVEPQVGAGESVVTARFKVKE
jgi:predicted DNA binding CopG/RHH family protein